MDLDVVVTAGLGDNSYLLVSGGEALAVDPQRDAWRLHQAADQRGATIRAILETHVHNDYVSGAHEIRAATGAQIIAPAKGRYEFPHRPVDDGDELLLGDLRLVAMATPGHTYEHIAYLVYEGDATGPAAVFTGGSLLVGSAGRPDLLGAEHTDELTRAQYDSLRQLRRLYAALRRTARPGAARASRGQPGRGGHPTDPHRLGPDHRPPRRRHRRLDQQQVRDPLLPHRQRWRPMRGHPRRATAARPRRTAGTRMGLGHRARQPTHVPRRPTRAA